MAVISVGTVWLAVTNLDPARPASILTVIMAVIALAFVVARVIVTGRAADHDHDHDDEDDADERPAQRALSIAALTLSVVLAIGALLLPPATLSAATASQRDITATQVDTTAASIDDDADSATYARYTVLEWSSLLAQTSDPGFYAGKPADLIGFITPDPDAADVFYVSRFSITCCAVDAQPIGVPVYLPDWQSRFDADDWVQVTGGFEANRSTTSSAVIALDPVEVTGVEEPSDPYLY